MKKLTCLSCIFICTILLINESFGQAGKSTGGAKDAHGCPTSAGYTWSVVKNSCIRIFSEAGAIKLMPQAAVPEKSMVTFIILSADTKQAEVFAPNMPSTVLIQKADNKKMWVLGDWTLEGNKKYMLKKKGVVQYAN